MSLIRTLCQVCFLLTSLLSVSVCCAAPADLQESIEQVLAEEGLVGVAWAMISEEREVNLGAAGLSDNLSQAPFTTDTRFHVGSVTKSLLSTGVLRLVTTGEIQLDAPVTRYLPKLPFTNPWHEQSEVTVRHLLNHTSGLDDARLWQMFSERPKADTPLVDAFPAQETLLKIRSRPGSRFSYSNMGYTLLGLIIESVTGDRYEAYLDKHLLIHLGMTDSTFGFTTQQGRNADPMLAWGHVDDGTRYAAAPVFLRPAAQFTTTAGDLAAYMQFLLGNGVLDGQTFIDDKLMQSRGKPSGTEAAESGLIAGYALGMARRDRHGVVGYCHGGNIVGFVAMLCIYPDENKAFAYAVNTDSETADYGRIASLLIDTLGVTPAPAPPTAEAAADIEEWHGWYVISPNRFQTFEYLDTVFGAIKISAETGSLEMTSLQQAPRQLRPLGNHLFSAADRASLSHAFLRGERAEYLISDGFKTFEKVPLIFLVTHWASILLGLSGLGWLLVTGIISLIRHRGRILKRAEAPAFMAILFLFVPVAFFLDQSFMALGDLTLASALLAVATFLLPFGMLLSILRFIKVDKQAWTTLLNSLAAVFVLQWCIVLATAGLLPLRLWT